MVKQIIHPKTDYLELLLNNDAGLTVAEIEHVFDDVSREAINGVLKTLHKKN